MKIKLVIVTMLFAVFALNSQTFDANWILKKVDENIGSDNKISISEMVIHGRRGSRRVKSQSWIQGRSQSFTEYLDPPREKGTKMLKLGDQIWTYTPASDRIILISGHMLRQSVMGSDLSYEDMMEDPMLSNLYSAVFTGEEEYQNRSCWILDLISKGEDIAYFRRKIWVDQERFVVLKENRYAKSGKLLKTTEVKNIVQKSGRWIPDKIIFKDVLKEGRGTEFILESIQFNAEIPDHIFTKASLRK